MRLYPNISLIFIVWFLSIIVISYFGFVSLPRTHDFTGDFYASFVNFDGAHYISIAKNGYLEKFRYAFFPLYPILINLVSKITGNFLLSAVLISWISTYLSLNFLYKLVLDEKGKDIAQNVILSILFFPMSFYFLFSYTEGLFLFLTIATFFYARKNRLFLATIFALLSSATRFAGVGVAMAFLVYIYSINKLNKKNLYVLLAPLGFIGYCIYLLNVVGDPFYFISAQLHWQNGFSIPGASIIHVLKQFFIPGFIVNNFKDFLDFIFVIFGIAMIIRVCQQAVTSGYRKESLDFSVYSLISIILPLFSQTLVAIPRYLLVIFPIFIALSAIKNKYIFLIYQIFSLMLLCIFTILFVNGYWAS